MCQCSKAKPLWTLSDIVDSMVHTQTQRIIGTMCWKYLFLIEKWFLAGLGHPLNCRLLLRSSLVTVNMFNTKIVKENMCTLSFTEFAE